MKKEDFRRLTRFRHKDHPEVYVVTDGCLLDATTGRFYAYFRLMERGNRVKVWIGHYFFGKIVVPEIVIPLDELELVCSVDDIHNYPFLQNETK